MKNIKSSNLMRQVGAKKNIAGTLVIVFLLVSASLFSIMMIDRNMSVKATGEHWWNSDWTYRAKITIDQTKVDNILTNFPILISITANGTIGSQAQNDLDDISFVNFYDNTTQLDHEFEYRNVAGGLATATIWVEVPKVYGSVNTYLWMYWGNAGCADQSDITGVWDANYIMVQHLNGSSAGTCLDSTSNNNDVTTSKNVVTYQQTGKAGYCTSFSNSYINVSHSLSLNLTSKITVEAWAYPTSYGSTNYPRVVEKYNAFEMDERASGAPAPANTIEFYAYSSFLSMTGSAGAVNINRWNYLVAAYDKDGGGTDEGIVYVDGVSKGTKDANNALATSVYQLQIGSGGQGGLERPWEGKLDEIRISNIKRNVSWINTTWYTISTPTTFATFGSPELESGISSCTLGGLTGSRFTWAGVAGASVWSNSSGTGFETGEFNFSYNGVRTLEYLRVNVTDLNAAIKASNISLSASVDQTTWRSYGAFVNGGSSKTINATTWTWADDPFPINYNRSIWVRMKLTIPVGTANATYSTAINAWTWDAGYYA